jgi:hypothetical protein
MGTVYLSCAVAGGTVLVLQCLLLLKEKSRPPLPKAET